VVKRGQYTVLGRNLRSIVQQPEHGALTLGNSPLINADGVFGTHNVKAGLTDRRKFQVRLGILWHIIRVRIAR
jgi:hypothetical protein